MSTLDALARNTYNASTRLTNWPFSHSRTQVVSYMTPLTGLTAQLLEQRGVAEAEALAAVRAALPQHAVLVGQSIMGDVRWLGLQEGRDFRGVIDLAGLFRVWNTKARWKARGGTARKMPGSFRGEKRTVGVPEVVLPCPERGLRAVQLLHHFWPRPRGARAGLAAAAGAGRRQLRTS